MVYPADDVEVLGARLFLLEPMADFADACAVWSHVS